MNIEIDMNTKNEINANKEINLEPKNDIGRKSLLNYTNKIKRNIKLDYVSTFITNLNMQSSIWVLYLAYCGMNLAEVGLLEGIYHATGMLCEIPSGAMADLLGRKKSMILSRICILISCIIMLFGRNFWMFALSFVIQALGNNFNSGSEEALVYDSMKCMNQEDKYMGVCGRINTIVEISQSIATVAGGILAEYSYFWCYVACAVIALLTFLPVIFMTEPKTSCEAESSGTNASQSVLKEKEPFTNRIKQHFITSFHIIKSDIRIFKNIVYYSVVFSSYTLLFFYSQQYYSDYGYNKIQISIILLFAGMVSCVGAVTSDKLYKAIKKKLAPIATVLIALSFVGYGFGNIVIAITGFMIASFCNSVLYPVQSEELNNLIPSEQRATLISVNSMFFSISMIITFPVAGVIADLCGLGRVFGILGIVILLFSLIWSRSKKRNSNNLSIHQ